MRGGSPRLCTMTATRPSAPRACALLRDLLGRRLVLVENPHLDVARRLVAEILLAVDGAARDIIVVAGLEHLRRLPLHREGDFALLDRGPLLAGMAMELVAGARWHGDGLQPHLACRVFFQRHREIALVL